jgi:hypothetical protein
MISILVSNAGAEIVTPRMIPIITWSSPADITYGRTLNSTQLNAIVLDTVSRAPIPGTFVYTPHLGTLLSVGTQTLKADFTPNDITNYSNASASVSINVIHGRPNHARNSRANHDRPNNGDYGGAFVPIV